MNLRFIDAAQIAQVCDLPGLIAHQSALKDGESMDVPDFGDPPAGQDVLDSDK